MSEENQALSGIKKIFAFIQNSSFLFWAVLIVVLSAFSLIIEFPFNEVFALLLCLFLPGYLLSRIVLGKLDLMETIVVGVLISMVIISFATFLLQTIFDFPFAKKTIIEAGLLCSVILVGFHYLRRFFYE